MQIVVRAQHLCKGSAIVVMTGCLNGLGGCRHTCMSPEDVRTAAGHLQDTDFAASSYHPLDNCCIHFAERLCHACLGTSIPVSAIPMTSTDRHPNLCALRFTVCMYVLPAVRSHKYTVSHMPSDLASCHLFCALMLLLLVCSHARVKFLLPISISELAQDWPARSLLLFDIMKDRHYLFQGHNTLHCTLSCLS